MSEAALFSVRAVFVKLKAVLLGLHHITAFAGDPRRNLDFYTRFLGLRLVKRTVNFDDPATYHFYFGDAPGTLLTFFPWPSAPAGRKGSGQAAGVSFTIPRNALDHWIRRTRESAVPHREPGSRFDQTFFTVIDPEGLEVELFATAPPNRDLAIVCLNSVTLAEADPGRTGDFLCDVLGAGLAARQDDRSRFMLRGLSNTPIDVVAAPGAPRAKLSKGMVHHMAFRVADEAAQTEWRERLAAAGVRVTRVIDRQYFRSIYFREPGGVLFEIATDGPGFLIDEPCALGLSLKLPSWLEPIRESIERRLPRLGGS